MSIMQSITTFFRDHGAKLLRYAGVSVIGVICGQTLLFLFNEPLGLSGVMSNVLAVSIATVPSYLLNRAWVWGKTGSHSVSGEMLPFWGMAFLGLLLSTVLVHFAEQTTDHWIWANIANLAAFGVLWVAKFFVLDRVLFAHDGKPAATPLESPASS